MQECSGDLYRPILGTTARCFRVVACHLGHGWGVCHRCVIELAKRRLEQRCARGSDGGPL